MANVKNILEKIKLNGVLEDIIAKSTGEHVTVTYDGVEKTLAAALGDIVAALKALPGGEAVDTKISAAIDELIGGAPETYDTLKEIADYISSHQDVSDALTTAIGGKVDKEEGKGLSANDFTDALKAKLEGMESVTAGEKAAWNGKAEKTAATSEANGLMSKEDKARLDGLRGVRYGSEVPEDMKDGEMFVRVVGQEAAPKA